MSTSTHSVTHELHESSQGLSVEIYVNSNMAKPCPGG